MEAQEAAAAIPSDVEEDWDQEDQEDGEGNQWNDWDEMGDEGLEEDEDEEWTATAFKGGWQLDWLHFRGAAIHRWMYTIYPLPVRTWEGL